MSTRSSARSGHRRQQRLQGQNFGTNVDYKLSARDVFSNSISINHRDATDNSRADYSEGSRKPTDTSITQQRVEGSQHRLHERAQAHDRAAQERAVGLKSASTGRTTRT
jgi:hypothetical protein